MLLKKLTWLKKANKKKNKKKKIGINEVIKRNEIINNSSKTVNIKWNLIAWDVKNIQKTWIRVSNTGNGKTMILSTFAECDSNKSSFIKNQETKGPLSNLGLRTPLSKAPILGNILFWMQSHRSIKWIK